MKQQPTLSDNSYRISYQLPEAYLEVIIKGFLTFDKYKTCWIRALDILEEKKCTALLIDLKEAKVISMESQEWLQEVYFPRMYTLPQFDVLRVVRVLADDVYVQIALENIDRNRETDQEKYPKRAKDFTDRRKALNWLLDKEAD